MNEIIKILSPLLLGGIGYIIMWFIVDPIRKQHSHIAQIIEYLISQANIIANPGNNNIDKRNNIIVELRNLSGGLTSRTLAIPGYIFFEKLKITKNKSDIKKTAEDLIRLSNSLFESYQDARLSNGQTLKRIYSRLGVKI